MTKSKEQAILKAAETMIREGGYNSFSFRDIAAVVGVKSSSVHYHFPTKADLGAAVAKNYTEAFLYNLGDPEALLAQKIDPIIFYIEAFRKALIQDKRICLCGVLGAETDALPSAVVAQTKVFFERNISWLTQAYTLRNMDDPHAKAVQTLALLEGGMIVSKVMQSAVVFDSVTKAIKG